MNDKCDGVSATPPPELPAAPPAPGKSVYVKIWTEPVGDTALPNLVTGKDISFLHVTPHSITVELKDGRWFDQERIRTIEVASYPLRQATLADIGAGADFGHPVITPLSPGRDAFGRLQPVTDELRWPDATTRRPKEYESHE